MQNEGRRVGLSFSGGLDSAACYWATGRPEWFFVPSANSKPSAKERATVEKLRSISPSFAKDGTVVEFDVGPMRKPGRNPYPRHLILTGVGIGLGFEEVWFGLHSWDPQHGEWPKTADGIDIIQTIILRAFYATHDVTLRYPVAHMSRLEVVKAALKNGCPEEFLRASWSCQYDGDVHCGECHNCVERYLTFRELGFDLSDFAKVPEESRLDLSQFIAVHAFNLRNSKMLRDIRALNGGKPIIIDLPALR